MNLFVKDTTTGAYSLASKDQLVTAALQATQRVVRPGRTFNSPRDIKQFLMVRMSHLEHEVFAAVYLTSSQRFIAFESLFTGTIDCAPVYPREVVKAVLRHNAAAVIFAHNHPSGEPDPSSADEAITRRLKAALTLIDVCVLDHIVVGADFCESFAERGLL